MKTIETLPIAKLKMKHYLDSKFSFVLGRRCNDLELPLRYSDNLLVSLQLGTHYQCSVDTFLKGENEPYCLKQQKVSNFYIIIRRGSIDYKITARDFRLELLRMKGVLK